MASIRTSLTQTFATNYLQLILQVIGLTVLARLLGPEEIGVYTVGAVFVAFAQQFRSFAVGQYIIQEPELTVQRIRAAFTVTLGLGISMALVLYLTAPLVGDFYAEPGVTAVLSLLSINLVLTPFGAILLAYLRRNLQFSKIMWVETASTLAHTMTGIILAYLGLSYMSLPWATIAGTVTSLILVQLMRPAGLPWLPGLAEVRRVFRFGFYMTGSTMLASFGFELPNLIIGKTLGLSAVGLLSRGGGVVRIFQKFVMRGVQPVIMPYLSVKQRSGHDLSTSYLYAVTCVTGLAWPFYISLALLAEPVVDLLLGSKWHEVTPLIRMWALAPSIALLTPFAQELFAAKGAVRHFFRLQTYMTLLRVVIVVAAAFHSLEALIIGFSVSQVGQRLIVAPAINRLIHTNARNYWRAVLPSLLVTLGTGSAVFLASFLPGVAESPSAVRVGAGVVAGLSGWYLSARSIRHPLFEEVSQALTTVRRRLGSK